MARGSALITIAALIGGCAATDYAPGVTSFAKAVATQDGAEVALIQKVNAIQTAQWLDQVSGHPGAVTSVNLVKCEAVSGYKAGDCQVTNATYGAIPPSTPSSIGALDRYAAALSSVASDNDCAALTKDATSLSTSLTSMADAARPASGRDISPIVSMGAVLACRFVQADRLRILQMATQKANPVIQALVAPIRRREAELARIVVSNAAAKLDDAAQAYNKAPSRDGLQSLIQLSQATDAAQQVSFDKTVIAMAEVHAKLTQDLKDHRVDFNQVIADAQSITDDATTIKAALAKL